MDKFEYDIYKEYKKFDNKTTTAARGGVSALELLLIAFIVLKLCKVINWSWWWVLSPFWIPLGLWVILVIIMGTIKIFLKIKKRS